METSGAGQSASYPWYDRIIDITTPNMPRVYDHWLGGQDATPADRQLAAQMERVFPGTRAMMAEHRGFEERAVRYVTQRLGISQIIDIGCGLPITEPRRFVINGTSVCVEGVHTTARRENANARIAFVDVDEVAVGHLRTFLGADKALTAVKADARDHDAVLGNPSLRQVIDLREPVAVIIGCLLHFAGAEEGQALVAGYRDQIAPGSAMLISCLHNDDDEMMARARSTFLAAAELRNHSAAQIRGFFDGLDLVAPGVVPAWAWRADVPDAAALRPGSPVYALSGVGIRR